jgi:GT2 family glycosyltransferase
LRSLAAQDFERDAFEVLVVDDGSTSPQRKVVEQFSGDLHIRLIEQANAGPAAARNAGALVARGQHLAFTDDDCRPDPKWLSNLAAALKQHPNSAIGGVVVNRLDNLFSTASQLLVDFLYDYFDANDTTGRFFVTSNCAMPTDLFREVGGFDLTFPFAAAEDRDLCERWQQRGLALVYSGAAVVSHTHQLTLWSFCRQHFTYGRGAWFLGRARQGRGGEPLRVKPAPFYVKLVLFAFSREAWPRAVVLSSLAALSQVVYVMGYLWQALTAARPTWPADDTSTARK